MKIGYMVPEFPSQTHNFFWTEIRELRKLGLMIQPISTQRPKAKSPHAFTEEAAAETHYLWPFRQKTLPNPRLVWAMLKYIWGCEYTPLPKKLKLLMLIAVAFELIAYVRREKIVHIHCHSCADSAHIVAMASLSGAFTYSLTLHGNLEVYGGGFPSKFRRATFVSVVSYDLQRKMKAAFPWMAHKFPMIRMGVDSTLFARNPTFIPRSIDFISVARVCECKGQKEVLRFLYEQKKFGRTYTYVIVGDGDYRPTLEKMVKDLDLSKQVTFLGALGEDEVAALIRHARVFVLASTCSGEAAPVSVMEALVSGVRVVASAQGGTAELMERSLSYTFEPGNFRQMENRLLSALHAPVLMEEHRWAVKEFSAETQAYKLFLSLHNL